MQKADYGRIAAHYDKGRALSQRNIDLWLGLISRFGKVSQGARVLDLGCGTGRFAIPMAERHQFHITAADSSPEMLSKAREKDADNLVTWDLQEAEDLAYPDNTFDVCFMSHLLHHVDSPDNVVRECHRVLMSPGTIIIRYGAIEQIRGDVEHTFFPETLAIDEAKTPTVGMVEGWLKETGFIGIVSKEIRQQTYQTGQAHLHAVKAKGNSVLTMISQDAFEKGIRELEAYLKQNPDDQWLLSDNLMLTVGYKT